MCSKHCLASLYVSHLPENLASMTQTYIVCCLSPIMAHCSALSRSQKKWATCYSSKCLLARKRFICQLCILPDSHSLPSKLLTPSGGFLECSLWSSNSVLSVSIPVCLSLFISHDTWLLNSSQTKVWTLCYLTTIFSLIIVF